MVKKSVGIRELIDACERGKSSDYKQGWREAICHVNDFYKIARRSDGESIDIVIGIEVSEEQILDKVMQLMREENC